MKNAIVSLVIFAASIIGAIILYGVVIKEYPDWGSFENLVYLGLITFGLGIGIYVSALLLEKMVRQQSR